MARMRAKAYEVIARMRRKGTALVWNSAGNISSSDYSPDPRYDTSLGSVWVVSIQTYTYLGLVPACTCATSLVKIHRGGDCLLHRALAPALGGGNYWRSVVSCEEGTECY